MSCEIFDFWCWTSNEIVGDVALVVFLYPLVLLYACIKLKIPKKVQYLLLILIFSAIFTKTLMIIIWVYVVLSVGLVVYYGMSKIMGG